MCRVKKNNKKHLDQNIQKASADVRETGEWLKMMAAVFAVMSRITDV